MSNPNGVKNLEAELAINYELRQALSSANLSEEQAELINRNLNSYTSTEEAISLEGYSASRPYKDEAGNVHNPFNDEVVDADQYFQFWRDVDEQGTDTEAAYEDMSKWDLAKIYSSALKAGDRTTTLNVAPVLRDKIADDHSKDYDYRANGSKVTKDDDIDYAFDNLVHLASKSKKPVKSSEIVESEPIKVVIEPEEKIQPTVIEPEEDTSSPNPEIESEQPVVDADARQSIEIPEEVSLRIEAFKTADDNIRICEVFDENNADGEVIDWNNYPVNSDHDRLAILETENEKYIIHGSKLFDWTKGLLIAEEEKPGDMPSTTIGDIWEVSKNIITNPIKKVTINSIVISKEDISLINSLEEQDIKDEDPIQEVIDFLVNYRNEERKLEDIRIRGGQANEPDSEAPTAVHEPVSENPHSQELVVLQPEAIPSRVNRVRKLLNNLKTKLYTFNPSELNPKEFFTDKENGNRRIKTAVTAGALAVVGYVLIKNGLFNGSEATHAHAVYTPNPSHVKPNAGMDVKVSRSTLSPNHVTHVSHNSSHVTTTKHTNEATQQANASANSGHVVEAVDNSSPLAYAGHPVSLTSEHNSIWNNVAVNLHSHGIDATNPNTAKVTDYIVSHLPKNIDLNRLPVGYTFNMPSEQVIRELLNLPV